MPSLSRRIAPPLLLLLALAGMAGCEQRRTPREMLENYLWRLENVTGLSAHWPSEEELRVPGPPRKRFRLLATSEFEIGMLDFLSLQGCGLGEAVGRRNSSLGRVMPASQRIVYELEFLDAAGDCIASLRADGEADLADRLAEVVVRKRRELPQVFWNAIFGSDEFAALFSVSAPPPGLDGLSVELQSLLQPLSDIESVMRSWREAIAGPARLDFRYEGSGFENSLAALNASRAGGALLRALHELGAYLDSAAELIEHAVHAKALCPMRKTTERGRYLRNVFDLFYAGEVQPYAAPVHRYGRDILSALSRIRDITAAAPGTNGEEYWSDWLGMGDASAWGRFEHALDRHTKAWQRALSECQLMPTAPS